MDKRVITNRAPRWRHSEALKRELVERSLQPGASVAALAQEQGINANLLFNWRRLHLAQHQAAVRLPAEPATVLLPVTVEEPVAALAAPHTCAPATPTPRRTGTGVIEVEIGAALVRLRGVVDDASVRCVLQALLELR